MHLSTAQCAKGAEKKCRQLAEKDMREIMKRSFQDYVRPLETVTSFK